MTIAYNSAYVQTETLNFTFARPPVFWCWTLVSMGHPKNCPFPFDDNHPHLIHLSLSRPHSPPQTASGSIQPFCHNTLCGQTDRPTDRWSRRMFR